jgi:hypothetical protein
MRPQSSLYCATTMRAIQIDPAATFRITAGELPADTAVVTRDSCDSYGVAVFGRYAFAADELHGRKNEWR